MTFSDDEKNQRDFSRTEMRVTFDGSDSEKRVCFHVINDEINEDNEAFAVVLRLDSTGLPDSAIVVLVPSHKAAILSITDDDCKSS